MRYCLKCKKMKILQLLTDHTIIATDKLSNVVVVLIPHWYADNYSKLSCI